MMKTLKYTLTLLIAFVAMFNTCCLAATHSAASDKLGWWRNDRFGMFIHYGLYSQCEGYWKGKPIKGIGEWIYKHAQIPVVEYKQLAKTFDCKNLNVDGWAKLAKESGMKYVVITTKHHDGFALFDSKVDEFNIVKATPYGKDLIREFVDACRKYGLKIGFYYSQFQDWSYPGAGGNDWEKGYAYSKQGFKDYMKHKALPQVEEILTNYGKIDMIWFDTPGRMSKEESEAFLNLAKKLQPEIIVSGRVGNDVGDYVQMEDNDLPKRRQDFDWEAPVTMNHTWAYKRDDHHWKTTDYILWQLTYSTALGGNYLLNIGPKGDGSVPEASVTRLNEVGEWMKVNSEAIYGAKPSPFINAFDWGGITTKGNKLFLNISSWPTNGLSIFGINNKIKKAYYLADNKKVSYKKQKGYLLIDLPKVAPHKHINVVVLELDGEPNVNQALVQHHDGSVILETEIAKNTTKCKTHFGSMLRWNKPEGDLSWNFEVTQPGKFRVQVITTGFKRMAYPELPALWDGGHEVDVEVGGVKLNGIVDQDSLEDAPYDLYNKFKVSNMGEVTLKKGMNSLKLIPIKIITKNKAGLAVRMVRLVPID